jgi:hypothetical protein
MMKINFFLTILKNWMQVYFTKPGEECNNILGALLIVFQEEIQLPKLG